MFFIFLNKVGLEKKFTNPPLRCNFVSVLSIYFFRTAFFLKERKIRMENWIKNVRFPWRGRGRVEGKREFKAFFF